MTAKTAGTAPLLTAFCSSSGCSRKTCPGGVGVDAALAASDRLAEESDLTRLHDQHYYAWVRVPARETAGRLRVLRRDDVVALSLLDPKE